MRGQELVDRTADQIALRDAVVLACRGIDVDVATVVVGDEDRVERHVEDGAQLLLLLAEDRLGVLALDRRGNQARGRPESVDLGVAPLAFRDAVVEADVPPPFAADEDRHDHQRLDLLRLEERTLVGGHVPDPARKDLVPGAELGQASQPDLFEAHVLHDGVVELRRDARRGPLEPLACDPPAVCANAVLEQIGAACSGSLAELLQEAGRRIAPARCRDQPLGAVRDRFEHGVPAMQCAFRSLAFDRGSHDSGSRSERIGFGAAPVALGLGVLEADESPPAFVDEDRHGEDRERACEGERLTLLVGHVADVPADDLAAAEHLGPAREMGRRLEVCEPRVVDGRIASARFPAGEPACVRRGEVGADVFEDMCARDACGLAENAHQLDDSFIEASLEEKALGRSAHCLEDRVAAAQVALGKESLLACAGARQDDRELAGDVDEHGDLIVDPNAGAGAAEPEDARQRPVAEDGHVDEGGDVCARPTGPGWGRATLPWTTSPTTIGAPASRRST